MHKLFDMVAGTSTGSLLTTSITLPVSKENRTNRYYSDDVINIYKYQGKDVF